MIAEAVIPSSILNVIQEKEHLQILRALCEEACRLMGAQAAMIAERSDKSSEDPRKIVYTHNLPSTYVLALREKRGPTLVGEVLRKGELDVISEPCSNPIFLNPKFQNDRRILEAGFRAICIIPLVKGTDPFGTLCLYHLYKRNYSLQERTLAHELGRWASIAVVKAKEKDFLSSRIDEQPGQALEKFKRLDQNREKISRLESLGKITKAISSSVSPSELFPAVVREIREAVPFDRCVISAVPGENRQMDYWHVESDVPHAAAVSDDLEVSGWFYREVYQTKQPKNIPSLPESGLFWAGHLIQRGLQSLLVVPIIREERVVAHIALSSRYPGAFSQAHEELLSEIAGHLGAAIQNASFFREAEKVAARLRKLNDWSLQVTGTLDQPSVLEKITNAVNEALDADISQLFLVEEGGDGLISHPPVGKTFLLEGAPEAFSPLLKVAQEVFEKGEPTLVPNTRSAPAFEGIEWPNQARLQSLLVYPLRLEGSVFGVVCTASMKKAHFSEEDLEWLKVLSDTSAVGIQNARLFEREKRGRVFFHRVVDENSDAMIVMDTGGKIVVWNSSAEKLFGFTKSEAVGKRPEDLIFAPRQRLEWEEKAKSVFSTGKVLRFEDSRIHRDGTTIPVSVTLSPVRQEDGRPVAMTAIYHDLRWKEQAETALKESDERFRQFVQHAADTLLVYDLHGNIVEVNKHACASLGHERGELLSMSLREIDLKLDLAEARKEWEAIRSGDPMTVNGLYRRKNGTTFPVEIRLGAFELKGRPHFLALVRDVSDRRQDEESLLKAVEEAESANQAKRDFISNISHELRSPLSLISGFSDLLMMASKEKHVVEIVPKIQSSAKHIAALIEDMVDMGRIERGEMNLNLEEVSINDLVTELVEVRKPHLRSGFALGSVLEPAMPLVFCDSTRVKQILTNLLENAINYSPEGGTIRIQTSIQDREVWVSVQDQGVGLDDEEKEKIFERFLRLDQGKSSRPGGLGIGLNLVRELVRLQGGRIWVAGEKGVGSTFTFSLPLCVPESQPETGRLQKAEGNGHPPESAPWNGRVIMIVDDDDAHHLFLKEFFQDDVARVISVYDGPEVPEMVRDERPDIVLMDIRMPTMDGLWAIDVLKSDPDTRDIPILVVTARATSGDREKALELGADGFLGKPLALDEFESEMRRLLGSQKT